MGKNVSAEQPSVRKSAKVEFSFWLSFDELHEEIQRRFVEEGAAARASNYPHKLLKIIKNG
jgi:hypothetical protein